MWHHAQAVMMLIMPPSPLQKKDGGFAKKYRVVIRHQIQENSPFTMQNFIQTWSLFQTTHILLQQLYTFFPATRILNENPKYVKKKDLLYFSTFLVRNLLLITILVCQVQSFYTQLGLQGAWGVVNTRMDNTTVFTRLMYS